MVTAIYASVLSIIICWLSLNVIKARRRNKVAYGDGGIEELIVARSAQSNAVDYIPITLILLFLIEYNGANMWLIHIAGISFVIGRIIHCYSILSENLKGRAIGMQITILTIVFLALLNLFYLPYAKFLLF